MMSFKRVVLLGGLWTAGMVLLAALLLVPAQWPFAALLMMLLSGGWLLLLSLSRAKPRVAPPAALCKEFALLVGDSSAAVSIQLQAIHEESERVLVLMADAIAQLSQGFHGIHRQTEIQRQLSVSVMQDAIDESMLDGGADVLALLRQQSINRNQALDAQAASAGEVDALISVAVKGLQVNDLVSQLIGHVLQRVLALERVSRELEALALMMQSELPSPATDEALTRNMGRVRQQSLLLMASLQMLAERTEKPPVTQASMAEGEIELF